MASYSAADIIGKTLIAKVNVPAYSYANDSAQPILTYKPGQTIGVVEGYVSPASGRTNFYWQLKSPTGKYYYVKHFANSFSLKALEDQGTKTTKEKVKEKEKAEEQANKTTFDKVADLVKGLAITAAIVYIGKEILLKGTK